MDIKDALTLAITIGTFLLTVLIPTIIMWARAWKKYKAAKTDAEKQAAKDEIKTLAQDFIAEAEQLYKKFDAIVKQQGETCGAIKKDSVMTKIQDACLTKGVAFEKEYWSAYVDKQVALTRQVNARQ